MAYDNIKSHKEAGLQSLSLENTFLEEPQRGLGGGGGGQIHPVAFLGLSHWPDKFLQDERLFSIPWLSLSRANASFIAIPYLA